jgi:predicted amidophosphoribosyltransferase
MKAYTRLPLQKFFEAFLPALAAQRLSCCPGCGLYIRLVVGDAVCAHCSQPVLHHTQRSSVVS